MNLCPEHRQNLLEHPLQALSTYKTLMNQGARHHNEHDYRRASQCFNGAKAIILLLNLRPSREDAERLLQLKVACFHNLAASLTAMGQIQEAEQQLTTLHQSLLQICLGQAIARGLRVCALGALDNSLFTLTSCLGGQGKVDQLYKIIANTEQTAELAAAQLLH